MMTLKTVITVLIMMLTGWLNVYPVIAVKQSNGQFIATVQTEDAGTKAIDVSRFGCEAAGATHVIMVEGEPVAVPHAYNLWADVGKIMNPATPAGIK